MFERSDFIKGYFSLFSFASVHRHDLHSPITRPSFRLVVAPELWKLSQCGKNMCLKGSGCGSVGRAVAPNSWDPQFESSHQQNFIYQLFYRNNENKEKEAGNGPSLKKTCVLSFILCLPDNLTSVITWNADENCHRCRIVEVHHENVLSVQDSLCHQVQF